MKTYDTLCEQYGWYLSDDEYQYYSIKSYITERLKFTSADDFLLQIKNSDSYIKDYLTRQDGNYFYLDGTILVNYSVDELNSELQKFSYRYCRTAKFPGHLKTEVQIVPENEQSVKYNFNDMLIHISPIPNLNETGLKPKKSKSTFEDYSERIYLFPIKSLTDKNTDLMSTDDIFNSVYTALKNIVNQFNTVKHTNDIYYIYLVKIKSNHILYKDQLFKSREAVYTLNSIPASNIEKLGSI